MKPIPSPYDNTVVVALNKAQQLLEKAEKLEMTEHEGKKVPAFAADGQGAKDAKKKGDDCPGCKKDDCPTCKMEKDDDCCSNCGANKMDCAKMGGCGGGKMEKAEPGYSTSFNSEPQGVMFMAESGGQTRNAYYTTNQYPYTGKDVANKGATSESFNMESLSGKMNPHEGGGADRQVVEGHLSKARDMLTKARCEQCGGTQYSGCHAGLGPSCPGLAQAGQPRRL